MLPNLRSLAHDPSLFLPLIIVLIALPFFFIGGPTWMSGPLFRALWDLGHIIFFAALLMVIQRKHPLDSWRWWLLVTAVVLLGGGAIEYLQTKVGRDGNWGDILGNLTGAWLGLFWFQKARRVVWVGRILASILLIPPLLIIAKLAFLQYQVAQDFPLISGLELESDLSRWDGNVERSLAHVTQGKYSLKIEAGPTGTSKAALRKFFGDWRHHSYLAFDIFNPHAVALAMTLRVHDAQHELGSYAHTDRFNIPLELAPGWNHYKFKLDDIKVAPQARAMEMNLIRGVEIFSSRSLPTNTIYLDNLRLE